MFASWLSRTCCRTGVSRRGSPASRCVPVSNTLVLSLVPMLIAVRRTLMCTVERHLSVEQHQCLLRAMLKH